MFHSPLTFFLTFIFYGQKIRCMVGKESKGNNFKETWLEFTSKISWWQDGYGMIIGLYKKSECIAFVIIR